MPAPHINYFLYDNEVRLVCQVLILKNDTFSLNFFQFDRRI